MKLTDEQVKTAMRGMYESFGEIREDFHGDVVTFDDFMSGPVSCVTDEDTYSFDRDRLEAMARAALETIKPPEPLKDVLAERAWQMARWGVQDHSWPEWMSILTEEVGEAAQAANHAQWDGAGLEQLREELIHVAAVAVQIVEAIDSKVAR